MLEQITKVLGGVAGGYIFYVQILKVYLDESTSTGVAEFIKTQMVWTLTSLSLVLSSVIAFIQPFLSFFDGTPLSNLSYVFPATSLVFVLVKFFETYSDTNRDDDPSLILAATTSALQIGV